MSELIRRINQNVVNNPDFTVIVDQGENNSFTFAQLDAYARRIAGKLSAMGVQPRDFVTIELPRNKEYLAAMYATWLVGAAFAPLSPTYPAERLEYIRSDCHGSCIRIWFEMDLERDLPFLLCVCPAVVNVLHDPLLFGSDRFKNVICVNILADSVLHFSHKRLSSPSSF